MSLGHALWRGPPCPRSADGPRVDRPLCAGGQGRPPHNAKPSGDPRSSPCSAGLGARGAPTGRGSTAHCVLAGRDARATMRSPVETHGARHAARASVPAEHRRAAGRPPIVCWRAGTRRDARPTTGWRVGMPWGHALWRGPPCPRSTDRARVDGPLCAGGQGRPPYEAWRRSWSVRLAAPTPLRFARSRGDRSVEPPGVAPCRNGSWLLMTNRPSAT